MNLSLAEAAEDIVRRIKSLGIRCEPDSRYGREASILKKGMIEPDDLDHTVAVESLRDVRLTQFALSELMGAVPTDVLADKVKLLVKDDPLPQDGPASSPGRDVQCELYVAGVCAKAGMKPMLAEPDVLCHAGGSTFGIAVKRVKSEAQFEKRFRDGARPIAAAGVPGILAMDMSMAFNPDNQPLVSDVDIYGMQLAHRQARHSYVDERFDDMKGWLRGREIRGLMILDHILRYDPSVSDWFLESMTFFVPFTEHNQRRTREFEAFRRTYEKGIHNLKTT